MKKQSILMMLMPILIGCIAPSNSSLPNGLLPLTPVEGCGVGRIDDHWVCSWAEEFDGDTLNESHWNVEVNGDGGGNQELQFYRRENITVEDGKLIITAKRESFSGKQYTSGRINSKYKVDMKYGRVSFRAKMPGGLGTWGALWMLPTFNIYGGWPNSGEIDMLEYVGYEPNEIFGATHTERFNHTLNNNPSGSRTVPNAETEFHDFDMIWLPGSIQLFVNGYRFAQFLYTPQFTSSFPYEEVFPFDEDFFFIMNLAVGGSWGGVQGVEPLDFPTTFEVDYLRMYQYDYALVDVTNPTTPINLALAQFKNTIHWNRSSDDAGVAYYEIFLNGEYYRSNDVNQFTFKTLTRNSTYDVQVRAVDYVGRVSELSTSLTFTMT